MKTQEIISILKEHKAKLSQKYPIQSLALFGSYAREEQTDKSDIDILVEFSEVVGMEIVELALDLDELLHTKVDLISQKALEKSPKFEFIRQDLIYV